MLNNEFELVNGFINTHPEDATREIESLSSDAALSLLEKLPEDSVATVLKTMLPAYAARLLLQSPLSFYLCHLKSFKARQVTAILAHFSEKARKEVYSALPEHQVRVYRLLLSYPQNTVGAYMRIHIEILPHNINVDTALKRILAGDLELEGHNIPVVNSSRHLVGTTDFKTLLKSDKQNELELATHSKKALIPSRMSLAAAYQHKVWQSYDTAFVHNGYNQIIGLVHHIDLRKALLKRPEARDPHASASNISLVGNAFTSSLSVLGQYVNERGRD